MRYGETPWSIAQAYGISVDEIRRLNGMAGDSTVIQISQKLLIRLAHTITPTGSGEAFGTLTEAPTQPLKENLISTVTPSPASDVAQSTTDNPVTPSPILTSTPTNLVTVLSTEVSNNKTAAIILLLIQHLRQLGRRKQHLNRMNTA